MCGVVAHRWCSRGHVVLSRTRGAVADECERGVDRQRRWTSRVGTIGSRKVSVACAAPRSSPNSSVTQLGDRRVLQR
ncbi:hypothetical protein OH77DRAFT_358139 [Trametes cingulata]|nr:hypothetical protein OH77DRAFT_358139 [Trametes cingulata]